MTWQALLRSVARLAFWLVTACAVATVALFLWAAVPVVAARAQGAAASLWFFGDTGLLLGAAWAWLAAAAALWWHRRGTRKRPPG